MPTQTNLDLSLVIAIAALVLSVVGPILSAWINGRYRIKEKKLDFEIDEARRRHDIEDRQKAEVIARYLTTAGAACKWRDPEKIAAFGSTMGEIYLYTDSSLWPLIDKINDAIAVYNDLPGGVFCSPAPQLAELAKALSQEGLKHDTKPKNRNK